MADPRRLNFVSLLLLAGLAAAGYWGWKFFPVYFTAWQVDHVLADAGAETYRIARSPEPRRSQEKAQIEQSTRARIVALGVDDPDLAVSIALDGDTATASADYQVVVKHPVGDKQTVMTLHRQQSTSVRRIQW